MTRHALERQAEMQVTDRELAACIANPEQRYSGGPMYEGKGEIRQRGRIAAVVHNGACLTVLWRTTKTYQRENA